MGGNAPQGLNYRIVLFSIKHSQTIHRLSISR